MLPIVDQIYNMLFVNLLMNITPALPAGGPAQGVRGDVGTPEHIPDRCFIVDAVTAADGFPSENARNSFNGFVNAGNQYHENFGFPITRVKSFWQILDFFKTVNTDIGRIRIVTHGMFAWMQFPMFPGGDFNRGITDDQLEAYTDKDEEGIRWTLTFNKNESPMIHDITSDILDGIRKLNANLLDPLKISAAGSTLSGDVKLFMDVVTDHYHMQFGTMVITGTSNMLNATQTARMNAAINFLEAEIRKRLEGSTVGTAPNTNVVTKQQLDNIKAGILAETPGKLELIGAKETLPAGIMGPAGTAGSLAHAMAQNPKVEADLRVAISGANTTLMFSNRTGEILLGLLHFHNTVLNLGGGVVITQWSDIQAVANLENYFFICNDLYMLRNGQFEISGGAAISPAQQTLIRDGLIEISDLIKAAVVAGGTVTSNARLNTLRTTIENLTMRESKSTNTFKTIPASNISELHFALGGINTGFRSNLNHIRTIVKSTTFVDIRGCRIGSAPSFLTNMRNFLGTGANRPTISAPEWWQSFPDGAQYHGGTTPLNVFPQIDDMVNNGFNASNITGANVTTSFNLWKGLIDFDPHFTFITGLFDDNDADRFAFATLEWRRWRAGGAGPGIPVLKMQAQRVDDLHTLGIGDLMDRFRIIFEVPAANGLNATQRAATVSIQPHVVSFKALKSTIAATNNPTATQLNQFYTALTNLGTSIDNINGTTAPGALQPNGPQNVANLTTFVNNVEAYIFANLNHLYGAFFTQIRNQLNHANHEIRYYMNVGLVLPVQSSSHPTITNPVVMISFENPARRNRMFMDAIRGWMKVQWKGNAAQATALNARIDAIALPGTLNDSAEFARRSQVSDGDPGGNPAGLDAHYCPTDDFGLLIETEP